MLVQHRLPTPTYLPTCLPTYLPQGHVERARQLFQQGVWADPRSRDTVYVFHAWGCLERDAGNIPLARELFKAAIKVDPKAEKVRKQSTDHVGRWRAVVGDGMGWAVRGSSRWRAHLHILSRPRSSFSAATLHACPDGD